MESRNKSTAIGWWIAAVLVNMMSLPFSLSAAAHLSQNFDPAYLVPAAFEIIGLLLLFAAIRATLRLEHFGHAYFELNSLPFSPGGHVAGAIHFQLQTDTPHGVDLKLSCIRRITTGSGNDRSTQSLPLWEDSKNVPAPSLSRSPLDTIIPVDFLIPPDAYQTDHEHSSDQVLWLLDVKADVPGVDYTDQFELPVFHTSQPQSTFPVVATNAPAAARFGRFTTTTPGEIDQNVPEPAQHRVVVVDQPDGLEFHFAPDATLPGRLSSSSSPPDARLSFMPSFTRPAGRPSLRSLSSDSWPSFSSWPPFTRCFHPRASSSATA